MVSELLAVARWMNVAHLVIFLDTSETVTNGETKENIGTESVDVHVA
jgi:hypothetical protein